MSEYLYAAGDADFKRLLSSGFSETEASQLLHMRNHITEEIEYREMFEERHRLNFIRWLIEHDRMSK